MRQEIDGASVDFISCVIPFWLILLCYLPLWLGIAQWQVMRKRRKFSIPDDSARDRGEDGSDSPSSDARRPEPAAR